MHSSTNTRTGMSRARWAAIGAALAVSLGAGGYQLAEANGAPTADASVFVPNVPCRAIDTRTPTGPIPSALTAASTVTVTLTGSVGECADIPADATALSVNITTVGATQNTHLTLWPSDETRPRASHINPRDDVSVTANGIDVRLADDGTVSIYNHQGTVHLVVDVLGAYVPGNGAAGPAGPQGPAGPAGSSPAGRQFGYDIVYTETNAVGVIGADGGGRADIAVGVDGFPIVAFNTVDFFLGVTHCEDIVCIGSTTTVFSDLALEDAGEDLSIVIGADGMPIISHQHSIDDDLVVTRCDDLACTTASHEFFVTANDDGWDTSITIGTDGLPIVSSFDFDAGDLVVTHCGDVECTEAAATRTAHSTPAADGLGTSITIGTDGLPVISHRDLDAEDLVMTHCDDIACTTATHTTYPTAPNDGVGTSITIGTDGFPIVAHRDVTDGLPAAPDGTGPAVVMTHCGDVACTTATHTSYWTGGADGGAVSIAVGTDGLPLAVVSHRSLTFDVLKDLMVIECSNTACTGGAIATYDTDVLDGLDAAIAIGSDGNPIISHRTTDLDTDIDSLLTTHLSRSSWTANGWD